MPVNVELPECGFHDKLSQPQKNSFVALCLLLGNPEVLKIIRKVMVSLPVLVYTTISPTPSANLFSFQAISLPSAGGERGTVFPFGLSANEDGGPNKQSSLACLRNTNR